jgi:hypothetical protein
MQRIRNILNCQNVAKHCKFEARGTVVPNTATASAPAVEFEMATFRVIERVRCVFWLEETKSATQVERIFRTQYRKGSPSRSTVLLRPDVLCAM